MEYVRAFVEKKDFGEPIYLADVALALSTQFLIGKERAAQVASETLGKMIRRDQGHDPGLRRYHRGIFYRAKRGALCETKIHRGQVIADKYLLPDIGYVTGYGQLNSFGLSTWMAARTTLATNKVKRRRTDSILRVDLRPAKTEITAENKYYLQLLDALELMGRAPVDAEDPYGVLADYIAKANLSYRKLLDHASAYFGDGIVGEVEKIIQREGRVGI